jgi:transcriptional regulator with XRE-family HTH domain
VATAPIHVPLPRRKLDAFQGATGYRDKDIAERLGVAKSTFSAYVNGDAKSAQAGTIPAVHFNSLTQLLVECSPVPIDEETARAAWLAQTHETLDRLLRPIGNLSLDALLLQDRKQLPVRVRRELKLLQRAMLDMDDLLEPFSAADLSLPFRTHGLRFDVECSAGRHLFMAMRTSQGWTQLVPSPLHDGVAVAAVEQLPRRDRKPLALQAPVERHRFVVIEVAGEPVWARAPAPSDFSFSTLQSAEMDVLVRRLVRARADWRWGDVRIDLDEPALPAPP